MTPPPSNALADVPPHVTTLLNDLHARSLEQEAAISKEVYADRSDPERLAALMRDKFIAYTAGSLLEAGSDTTASSILVFLLYMVCYPEVLKKAQAEIDRVVGGDRMPGWEDEEKLPYLIACIKESWRIRSITNGSSPRYPLVLVS